VQELISPTGAELFVAVVALVVLVLGAVCGFRAVGPRGICAGLLGPLAYALWQLHKWLTRYDPHSGYFGLESLWVLLGEVVGFVVLGLILSRIWDLLAAGSPAADITAEAAQPKVKTN
jgi:hypothetical protein